MTPHETRLMETLAQKCADLKVELSTLPERSGNDYLLTGTNAAGRTLIRVQATSLPRAQRLFVESYRKLERSGMLKPSPTGEGAAT